MKKIVLVIGASGSIGEIVVKNLLQEGYFVIASSKNEKKFKRKFKSQLLKHKKHFHFYRNDLADTKATERFISNVTAKYKSINYFINCAGKINRKNFNEETIEEYNEVLNTNFVSPMIIVKELLKKMKLKNFGKIINLSSQMAKIPHPGAAPSYEISKSSINTLTRHLVKKYAQYNIYLNVISPGTIKSDMQKTMKISKLKEIISNIPSKKLGNPQDVANLVLYLFSNKSNYINGAVININGGSLLE